MPAAKPVQMPYGAYHRTDIPGHDAELTEIQPGSPMGEYMRRFWHPVCLSDQLADVPQAIRILGEDLVAFRDRSGRVGVLQRHCSHRGTSLEYGIIQPKGIRCCYHGWVYDIDGTILEMPAEPKNSRIYQTIYHGAYPAFERSGLVFAYMGEPEQRPEFPEYDSFTRPQGTKLVAFSNIYPCNFLQAFENVADHFHTAILHNGMTVESLDEATKKSITLGGFVGLPTVHWEAVRDGNGIMFVSCRRNPDNQTFWVRSIELSFPNFIQFGGLYASARRQRHSTVALSRWHVPVDNHNVILFGWRHFNDEVDPDGEGDENRCGYDSIDFLEGQTGGRSYEDGQRAPGDWEALSSQRSIAIHALENPGCSDTGVYMLRQLLREAVRGNTPADSTREGAKGGKDTLHVYTQDTVINVPKRLDGDDEELMMSYGLKILEIMKEANNMPGAQRDAHVRACLDKLDGGLLAGC
ncbi:MAG: Rieske 2Fe-2S domain-containing protein [Alphaproteobacteria bacterium]|nr:Rieske 2Fe-2S domain-containing protein [Alphaproteobacteria bacterium]